MARPLCNNEIMFFRSMGYLRIPQAVDIPVIENLTQHINKAFLDRVAPIKTDENGNIAKIYNLSERHRDFYELFSSEYILSPLRSLLGPNIEFVKNRHNHASVISKGMNQRRFHRDILHWSRPNITVLIYLQETSQVNGCTEIIPGSQYFEFVPASNRPEHGGTWMDEHECYRGMDSQALPVPSSVGDILLLDSLVFHTPGINSTDETRVAITASYRSVDELLLLDDPNVRLVSGQRVYCGNELSWEK